MIVLKDQKRSIRNRWVSGCYTISYFISNNEKHLKQLRCDSMYVENIIDKTYDKWGSFQEKRKYKETVVSNQKYGWYFGDTWWENGLENITHPGYIKGKKKKKKSSG